MQTRYTNKYSNIITGILNNPNQILQQEISRIDYSNLLYGASPQELATAIRDNRIEMEFCDNVERDGLFNPNNTVNSDVISCLTIVAESVAIQRDLVGTQYNSSTNASNVANSR